MSGTVPMDAIHDLLPRASTGVPGLDDVLAGGLARNRLHLLEGSPGTGKTTIALQFLMAGAAQGERGSEVTRLGHLQGRHDLRACPSGKRARPGQAPEPALLL